MSENCKQIVDQLGKVKAKIADLQEQEGKLRDALVTELDRRHVHEVEGRLFRATVSHFQQTKTDYKAVVEELPQTDRLRRILADHTETVDRTTVKVVSR